MNLKDITVTAAVALATLATTLAAVGPLGVTAQGEEATPYRQVLKAGSVEIIVHAETDADGQAVAVLTFENKGETGETVSTKIQLYSQSPASMMSRMASLPQELWTKAHTVRVEPNEVKEVRITAVKLPQGQWGYFRIGAGDASIASNQFGVKATALSLLAIPNGN